MKKLLIGLLLCGSAFAADISICTGQYALCAASPTTPTGKTMQVQENHYRNLYSNKEGQSMKYTGNKIPALPVPKSSVASFMLDVTNNVTSSDPPGAPGYLTVLKNFYASKLNHSVDRHSDDDPQVYLSLTHTDICHWNTLSLNIERVACRLAVPQTFQSLP